MKHVNSPIEGQLELFPDIEPTTLRKPTKDVIKERLEAKLSQNIEADRILLTRAEAAYYLGLSKKALDSYSRTKYADLRFSKIGGRAIYRLSDVLAYLTTCQKGGI
jgi:hypothetical protein